VQLDREGGLVRAFGRGLLEVPHGLHIDHEGSLWATDVGAHVVLKLSPSDGGVLLRLGTAGQPGAGASAFNKPTDVAVLPRTGNVYVSDGYGNSRIAVFSSRRRPGPPATVATAPAPPPRDASRHAAPRPPAAAAASSSSGVRPAASAGSSACRTRSRSTSASASTSPTARMRACRRERSTPRDAMPCDAMRRDAALVGAQVFDAEGKWLAEWVSSVGARRGMPSGPWHAHVSSVSYSAEHDVFAVTEGDALVLRSPSGCKLADQSGFNWPHDALVTPTASYGNATRAITAGASGFSVYVAELDGRAVHRLRHSAAARGRGSGMYG